MIKRAYKLENYLKPNKAVIIMGPRRAGKTTLVKEFLKTTTLKYKSVIGDELSVQQALSAQNIEPLKDFIGPNELLVIDEAQKIPNIGLNIKIIVDNLPGICVLATGSSSFELRGQIGEPLVGRKTTLPLYPFSQKELLPVVGTDYDLIKELPEYLVYGSYPEVITAEFASDKIRLLQELLDSYLLKDILELDKVKGAKILLDLLRLLAFQVGGEVSLSSLSREIGMNVKTIARYLDLFEKNYIIYNLRGFSRNLRSEINRKSKYYFLDNGVRNVVIGNFNSVDKRPDIGALWENFLVTERLKRQAYDSVFASNFFWRTWEQKEIDWVEEREGKLFGFEFKYSVKQKSKKADEFLQTYKDSSLTTITSENYLDFVI